MQPSNTPEEWRPVVGYEGRYEVSNVGQVRRVARIAARVDGTPLPISAALMRAFNRNGYMAVRLTLGGRESNKYVHRLVLESFVGPGDGMVCCHGNGDRKDNRLENLRWGTHGDNALDKVRHGREPKRARTHCPRGHALESPNLVRHSWEVRGHRNCLSCARAISYLRRHRDLSNRLDEVADQYYEKLMRDYRRAS